jgi:hypothetical protein
VASFHVQFVLLLLGLWQELIAEESGYLIASGMNAIGMDTCTRISTDLQGAPLFFSQNNNVLNSHIHINMCLMCSVIETILQ